MTTYRIYALILGEILPEAEVLGCHIKKMPFDEQAQRKFKPVQIRLDPRGSLDHRTYMTSLMYVDPIRMKSEHIISCEVEENDAQGALGGAIRQFDKLCRVLTFSYLEDTQQHFTREAFPFQPYVYQVNKIYKLDGGGGEVSVSPSVRNGAYHMPDRPSLSRWRHANTLHLLEELGGMHDDVLERAMKYLYRSAIGNYLLDSPEKVALDHMKSIEIIVDSLSNERDFENRLQAAKVKLSLSDEEVQAARDLWNLRSQYGDIAHFSRVDEAERYPNQFPLPNNASIIGVPDRTYAANICLKYFHYRRKLFNIELKSPDEYHADGTFASVNSATETNHLWFYMDREPHKGRRKQKIKTAFAYQLGISENDVDTLVIAPQGTRVDITIR